jgi:hypothetical protein
MSKHKNLSGTELHYPLGRSSEGALALEDDTAYAYQIKLGANNMFNVSTINSAETLTLGNSTDNPKVVLPGTGNVGLGTIAPTSPNGNQVAIHMQGTSVGLVLDSTNGSAAPWEIQHNSSDMKIIYDGANSLGGGAKTAIVLDADGRMRLGAETATPSDPGAGNGGFVYVKSDGKLYFRSNSTTETDLTAGGGGVTNPLSADLNAGGYHIAFNNDTGIKDEAGNESLLFGKTTDAVNHFAIINAATGGEGTAGTSTAPILRAIGSDTNVDLALEGQGTGTVTVRSRGSEAATLTLNEPTNTYGVNLRPPADLGASYTLTLPADDGTANQVLETDGSGNLSWATVSSGSSALTVEEKNSNTVLTGSNKFIKANSSSSAITLTLPTAVGITGETFIIKDIGNATTNAVTIATNGSQTIDGSTADLIINNNYASVELISDGANWWIR